MTAEIKKQVLPEPIRTEGYIWDAINIRLLAYLLKPEYVNKGMWPSDGVDVSYDVSEEYTGQPPTGKTLGVGDDGMPAWVDIPPPTQDELTAQAKAEKEGRIKEASNIIAPLKDALEGGYIDDDDKLKLTAWQKYRYELTKVDAVKPVWPEKPAA